MPGDTVEGADEIVMPNNRSFPKLEDHPPANDFPIPPSNTKNTPKKVVDHPSLDASIDQLYDNVCEMMSSGDSCITRSFGSEGEELRIDSELHHLAGGETGASQKGNGFSDRMKESMARSSDKSSDSSMPEPENKDSPGRGDPRGKKLSADAKKRSSTGGEAKSWNGTEDFSESALNNSDLGHFNLKRARELISGDHHKRALDYALRAVKSFERTANGKPCLDLVMSLHVLAGIYSSLGQYEQAIPALKRSIQIPSMEEGQSHALAQFAGQMQLGDTYSMMGQLENSIACYSSGLEIQSYALGAMDPRVGETCRFLAEVHLQALQLDEAKELCRTAMDIHRESGEEPPLEETADRRLMALISQVKGDHEEALEHLVMASTAMAANGQVKEVAYVDCSIGDAYLSLARYDEAVFAYRRALSTLKCTGGENHPTVAHALVRLADLFNRMGRLKESKAHCEDALRIFNKPPPGSASEEIAAGLADVAALYVSMNEHEEAIKLLQRALKLCDGSPGQQSAVAGMEAQMGVLCYAAGDFIKSRCFFHSAISKLRNYGEKKQPAFLAVALNQMGLACVQLSDIQEAAGLFQEAKSIMEKEHGPHHPETLEVYSNLAATYDAMGRWGDATGILEHIVSVREEKLGTANPEVEGEKRRLAELLKESGRVRRRKAVSLNYLFGGNSDTASGGATAA
ncbi:unnamed protein product [Spirodela intermedia]|uniref:Uncharacterized protein n=1 Tax=Spirodela intermedia TaxID=51605 RepID=A0A7I8KZ78_SPIIN|nr:unnamed protein product [Spirodela intermedia]